MRARTALIAVALFCAVAPVRVQQITATDIGNKLEEAGSVALYGIRFDRGSATMTPDSKAVLAAVGDLLHSDPVLRLEIRGHTDNVGSPAVNLRLSQDRAVAVKNYLVTTFKIAPQRLNAVGFGDTKPVANNSSEEGRMQNQRVELVRLATPTTTER